MMNTFRAYTMWHMLAFSAICFGVAAVAQAGQVTFPDAHLEAAIRDAISKPAGDILDTDLHELSDLSAGGKGISDLSGIEHCTNLTYLDLANNQISDVSPLSGLVWLEDLILGDNQIADVSPLSALISLEYLYLYDNQISDVSPLSGLTNLAYLYLDGNQISDVSPLSGLVWLTSLDLDGNQISDVSPLSGLVWLEDLSLCYNQIADVSPLSALISLEYLGLDDNQISDVSPLSGLTDLTYLHLNRNWIADVSPLSGLVWLTGLYLDNNQIADISPLSGLVWLTNLNLYDNQLVDVNPLSGLVWLEDLSLGYNQIADVSPLSGLVRLTDLALDNNQISDVSPLSGLVWLTGLYLDNNQIVDVSALSALTSLEYLWLDDNQIVDVSPLSGLVWLEELGLGYNQIADVSPLSTLTSLEHLDLYFNQISDVSPLSALTSLEYLSLDNNQIADVSPLSALTSLQYLSLDDNQIVDVSPLLDNTGLGDYDCVALSGNPLSVQGCSDIAVLAGRGVSVLSPCDDGEGGFWIEATANAGWQARWGHAAAVFENRLWILGGTPDQSTVKNDVWWSADGVSWRQATGNAAWPARGGHTAAVFDGKLWVLGGTDRTALQNDVWYSEDGAAWTQATAHADWPARTRHTSAVFHNRLWILGGADLSGHFMNDVWYSEDGVTWIQATANAEWNARGSHTTAVFDDKLWVLGGTPDGSSVMHDVWWSADGISWEEAATNAWEARASHTTVVFDNKLWVIGGDDLGGTVMNDAWWSGDGETWIAATGNAGWTIRAGHASAAFQNKLWVLGGSADRKTGTNDVWYSEGNEDSFTVSGTVTDAQSGALLANAVVTLFDFTMGTLLETAYTGNDGSFALSAQGDEDYLSLHVEKAGYDAFDLPYFLAPAIVDVLLAPVPPSSPEGLVALPGADQILLRWNAPAAPDIAGYRVYRANASDGAYLLLEDGLINAARFVDTTVATNRDYWYRVTAVDSDGNESGPSPAVTARAGQITIWIPDVNGAAGERIRIPINATNTAGLSPAQAQIVLVYDGTVLDASSVAVEHTAITSDVTVSATTSVAGEITIETAAGNSGTALIGEGHIFDVYATIRSDAPDGVCGALSFSAASFRDTAASAIAVDYTDTAHTCVSGLCRLGDLDGNGAVQMADATVALAIAVQKITAEGCQAAAGDMNGDGLVDSADAVMIMRASEDRPLNPAAGETPVTGRSVNVYIPEGLTAAPGETIAVPIMIGDVAGIGGGDFLVTFPAQTTSLVLESILAGGAAAGFDLQYETGAGFARISMSQSTALAGGKAAQTLAILNFAIASTAPMNSRLAIGLNSVKLSGQYGDDFVWKNDVSAKGASVSVSSLVCGAVVVSVVDATTSAPVDDASVQLSPGPPFALAHNTDGMYVFSCLNPGTCHVSVSAPDYDTGEEDVAIVSADIATIVIRLNQSKEGGCFRGTVSRAVPPVPGNGDLVVLGGAVLAMVLAVFTCRRSPARTLYR